MILIRYRYTRRGPSAGEGGQEERFGTSRDVGSESGIWKLVEGISCLGEGEAERVCGRNGPEPLVKRREDEGTSKSLSLTSDALRCHCGNCAAGLGVYGVHFFYNWATGRSGPQVCDQELGLIRSWDW